jgi:hypothetical protein
MYLKLESVAPDDVNPLNDPISENVMVREFLFVKYQCEYC